MSDTFVDAELESARLKMQAALETAGVADRIKVVGSVLAFVEVAEARAERCLALEKELGTATIDPVTGLLRTDQWREQLAVQLGRLFKADHIDSLLEGAIPLKTARMMGKADAVHGVVLATFDAMALGHVNNHLGYAAGSKMLAQCTEAAVTVLDEFLRDREMYRRRAYGDPMNWCSMTRTGGDEFRMVLVGLASTRWLPIRQGILQQLQDEEIEGADIPPAMAVGAMSIYVLLWYLGAFYGWLSMSIPDIKTRTTHAIQLWCTFTEVRGDAQKFLEYGLLFSQEWNDDPGKRERFEEWLTTKMRASAFNGRSEEEVRDLCKKAAVCLEEGDHKGARTVFEHDWDDRMQVHLNVLVAKARALRHFSLDVAMQIFVIAKEHEFDIPGA